MVTNKKSMFRGPTSKRKIRVAVLFGGKSAEHEVSVRSARNVIKALDKTKYEPVPIKISRDGGGYFQIARVRCNVAFPVLHGPFGEDGTVQGMLKLANIPFVGTDVLGSAVGMDKDFTKRLLRDAGVPVAKFVVFHAREQKTVRYAHIVHALGGPFFLKPANLGSSIGVSKASNTREFQKAANEAFRYDTKILAEEYIRGREIECAVLGNEHPVASVPGEIIPRHEFYSYEAKYLDENGAALEIPAKLPRRIVKEVQRLAITTFQTLGCEGMARVDFFLTPRGKLYVNEINTIPGFTNMSMYPKLWEASGISYPRLIDRLIQLAFARHRRDRKLKTSR